VKQHPPGIVRLSPILTDPYQPIEHRYRITRCCLEVLLEAGFTPVILTRAARVLDDLDLFRKFPRALVGFSIPTDDDRVRHRFEPGADRIERRVFALKTLRAAGIRTFGVIQPILPMNPERLIDAIADHVSVVRIDRLYFGESVRHVYVENGYQAMMEDDWIEATRRTLVRGFEQRGVRVDDLERLEPLLRSDEI
jgi:DNA repair photolyase